MSPVTMTRRLRRSAAAALALVTVGALAACSPAPVAGNDPPTTTAVIPTPPGASFGAQPREDTDSQACDATESLRPQSLPSPGSMPAGSTMDRIAQRGRLIVGTDIGSNPLSFRDPISGDIEGFDVDVATWLSEAVFGESRIEYRILSTGERVSALKDGDVDVVVKSMSITCNRLKEVEFSAPYLTAGQRTSPTGTLGSTTSTARPGNRCAPPAPPPPSPGWSSGCRVPNW